MKIALDQYFAPYPELRTPEFEANATELLTRVDKLLSAYPGKLHIDPDTKSYIGGEKNGGVRPLSCPVGSSQSSHKKAKGVDVYDPGNLIDKWADDAILAKYDLYREHPNYTDGWCHLTTRPPGSGKRSFIP